MNQKDTILVVEDKKEIGLLLQFIFSNEYNVVYKENAVDALLWLQEGNVPILIISDISMPQMSGIEFLERLKSNMLYRSIPVFILSGREDSQTRIDVLEAGADDYIVKPFNPQELKVRVRNTLKKY